MLPMIRMGNQSGILGLGFFRPEIRRKMWAFADNFFMIGNGPHNRIMEKLFCISLDNVIGKLIEQDL